MNSAQPRLLLGLTPLAERAIEDVLFSGDLAVVGSAADAGELLSLADRADAEAVLLSAELSGLAEAQTTRLRSRGLRLVGLALDARSAEALRALGVDELVEPPLYAADLARSLGGHHGTGEPEQPLRVEPRQPTRRNRRERSGNVIAVVGCAGSPGASECAASLAALAASSWRTLLVELNLLAPSLDLRLGADPQRGSLIGLVRAISGDGAVGELLDRWTCAGDRGWPPVLLAPPQLDEHIDELGSPGAIHTALDAAASLYPLVVADVGSLLALPGEQPAVVRCHREALLSADAVILVTGAGEEQLRAGRNQLTLLLDTLAVPPQLLRICVNGVGAPGGGSRRELEDALGPQLAELRLAVDCWLPFDRRALARARRTGQPLALARPRGGYARALHKLLDDLLLPAQPIPRERKERLTVPAPEEMRDEEVSLPWRS
jgi:hypothetical protein